MSLTNFLTFADIILAYFASHCKHNPNLIGTWKQWIGFLKPNIEYFVNISNCNENINKMILFIKENVFNVGKHENGSLIMFGFSQNWKTKPFKKEYTVYQQCYAVILYLYSVLWDIQNDTFNFHS